MHEMCTVERTSRQTSTNVSAGSSNTLGSMSMSMLRADKGKKTENPQNSSSEKSGEINLTTFIIKSIDDEVQVLRMKSRSRIDFKQVML